MTGGRSAIVAAALVIALIFGGTWILDFEASGKVHVAIQIKPSVLPGDGFTTGDLTVRVTGPDGAPRVGDTVEVLDEGLGYFDRTRALTDKNGAAVYVYTPARSTVYTPAAPARVLVTDISLGRLIEFDKVTDFMIPVVDPSKYKGQASGAGN